MRGTAAIIQAGQGTGETALAIGERNQGSETSTMV